jgi:hypothetical protein
LKVQFSICKVAARTFAPAQVTVTQKINSDTYSQETGIFLSVFSRDYPKVGFGLGFHTSSGRAPSVYLGPTLRLRGLGEHALVTASMGLSVLPVRRFPGVQVGDSYDATSAVLAGKVIFKGGYYALINLEGKIASGAATRSTSPTLQAWAKHPRGRCGGSPS